MIEFIDTVSLNELLVVVLISIVCVVLYNEFF